MKIKRFSVKSHQCHCEELAASDEAISEGVLTEIASLRPAILRDVARNDKTVILALGAESAGNFSVFHTSPLIKGDGEIYFSDDFGDLLDENNFKKFQKAVLKFLKKNKIKPDIILTDLHPLYKTTIWGMELSKKFKAEHSHVQHHIAHIFSAIGEKMLSHNSQLITHNPIAGIALDGTGYGLDGKIWGGEIFQISPLIKGAGGIKRIGHLENQIMIGGDLAVKEPARMLIAILAKIKNQKSKIKITNKNSKLDNKKFIYKYIKKFYTRNQFELLYNQLQNNFNCQETSSAGRILDAVSVLLGFCGNERKYKHEAADLLEKNSTKPYQLPPLIKGDRGIYTLQTTYLFEYLINNLHRDKKRLAATAQLYIAQGLYELIKKQESKKARKQEIFLGGGISNNKIISSYLESTGAIANKKIYPVKSKLNGVPRGDAGISFGQIIYQLIK